MHIAYLLSCLVYEYMYVLELNLHASIACKNMRNTTYCTYGAVTLHSCALYNIIQLFDLSNMSALMNFNISRSILICKYNNYCIGKCTKENVCGGIQHLVMYVK